MSQYFKGIKDATKTLATGLKVTMKEYFTPKSTEQYPENRKTTLHVSARHRGRLVFKRVEDPNDPQAVKRGLKVGDYKCTACTMCEKACPNDTIKITAHMETDPETGRKKKVLDDYQYDLGDCMFCQLCVNACNFDAIISSTTSRMRSLTVSKLVLHLDKEVYKGGSLPNLIDGGAPLTIGKFNTKTK
jgi:NADH-quinone oxidoreductase subunit I